MTSLPPCACRGEACPCRTLNDTVAQIGVIEAQEASGLMSVVNTEILGDREFSREAFENSAAKVQLGQLAQQKSQSDYTKQFSEQMIRDSGDLSEQAIVRVAMMLAVNSSKSLPKKDKELAANLQGLSIPHFDEEHIKVITKAYRQDLKKLSSEATLAQDLGGVAAGLGASIVLQLLQLLEQIAEHHDANRGEPVRWIGRFLTHRGRLFSIR
jgi:predicted outer membrane protein